MLREYCHQGLWSGVPSVMGQWSTGFLYADAEPMKSSSEDRLVLTVTADQRAFIGKSEVPMERLVAESLSRTPSGDVSERTDRERFSMSLENWLLLLTSLAAVVWPEPRISFPHPFAGPHRVSPQEADEIVGRSSGEAGTTSASSSIGDGRFDLPPATRGMSTVSTFAVDRSTVWAPSTVTLPPARSPGSVEV